MHKFVPSTLLSCFLIATAWAEAPTFRVLEKGKTPSFSTKGPRRQDLSAAACVDGIAYLAYDGGANSEHPDIRVTPLSRITHPAPLLNRVIQQRDLEAMTYHEGVFYVISGLSQADEDTEGYRLLASFTLDATGRNARKERSVAIRDVLLDALRQLPDERWFSRIAATFGVKGGLNAEGLSWVPGQPDTLVVGLRSPLYGPAFGDPTFGKGFTLDQGRALLAFLTNPFSEHPTVRLQPIDLGGQGIRDIQYIPSLGAYLVIGGPVDKAPEFSLWLCRPEGVTERIHLPELNDLCRPEAIMPVPGSNEIYLFSEEGEAYCEAPEYTYLRLAIQVSATRK